MTLKIECAAKIVLPHEEVLDILLNFALGNDKIASICDLFIDEFGNVDRDYIAELDESGDEDAILWNALHSRELQGIIDKFLTSELRRIIKSRKLKSSIISDCFIQLKRKAILLNKKLIAEFEIDDDFNEYVNARIVFLSKNSPPSEYALDISNQKLCEILLCDEWSARAKLSKQKEYERNLEFSELAHSRLTDVIISEMGYEFLKNRKVYMPARVEIIDMNGQKLYTHSFV